MTHFQRILLPTDFSDCAAEAARHARALVEQFNAELHLLHVLETHHSATPVFGGGLALAPAVHESRQAAEAELDRFLDPQWQQGQRVVRAIADGAPAAEIVHYAEEHQIDLIVLGTHGHTGLTHALLGSVSEKVVRKAPCPVLTVRTRES
jgi:nucleotide-binding universal stress UspA family protein